MMPTLNTCLRHAATATSIAVLTLALGACSILPKSEPLAVYRLPATATATTSSSSSNTSTDGWRSLRILTPYANRTIDSERILVLPEADVVKSYAGVRWSDPAPLLLRDRLLDAFNVDGRFGRLSGDNANIAAELELNGSLSAFQTEYRNGVPTVVIQFDARLVDTATRQQLAARRFSVAQAASGAKIAEVVAAFGAASGTLATQLVDWTAGLPQSRVAARR